MIHQILIHKLSYIGMFALLASAGIIVPIPEEITLLASGYFSALGLMEPWKAMPIAIVAILIGDSILFFLARTGARYARTLRERLGRLGLERTWVFSPAHPLRAVFVMRFATGLRFISPIYAGFHGASWIGFLSVTFCALLIFVPALFSLGYYFHASFYLMARGFAIAEHVLFAGFLALVAALMLWMLYRFLRREKEAEVAEGALTPAEAARREGEPHW